MPIYEYKCGVCGKVFDKQTSFEKRTRVRHCDKVAERRLSARLATFKPRFVECLDAEPVYVKSMKHLNEEAKKRNLIVERLPNVKR